MVAGETLYQIVGYSETTEEFVKKIRDLRVRLREEGKLI